MSISLQSADDWEESPLERLDEAFGLLRSLPVTALGWCVIGPVPFVLGMLYFWSDLTRGGQSALTLAGWAAVLAGVVRLAENHAGLFCAGGLGAIDS